MSAFLAFSNKRRAGLKRQHPDATNADLSKILSRMWKEATPEFKAEYVEEEARKRAQYKIDIAAWRKKKSEQTKAMNKAARRPSEPVTTAAGAVSAGIMNPNNAPAMF